MDRRSDVEKVKELLSADFSFNEAPADVELPRIEFKSIQELLDYCAELKKSASTPEEELELEEFCQELVEAWLPRFAGSEKSQGGGEE